jgi:PAS domain-containing protein
VDSSVVRYDGDRNVRDEELSVGRKKSNREQTEETKQSRWGFRGMTVRNWLELLIVPLVLVVIGLLFEIQQANRQQAMEEQQQALEERRAEAERELAEQRAQDEALQAYLDQMSQLMLDRKLLEAEQGDPVIHRHRRGPRR